MKKLFGLLAGLLLLVASPAFAVVSGNISTLAYATTNVTTSAYVVLVTSLPISASHVLVCDTSTKLVKIAVGATGSEYDIFTAPISGCATIGPKYLKAGIQLSIKAIDANATTGFNTLSFY